MLTTSNSISVNALRSGERLDCRAGQNSVRSIRSTAQYGAHMSKAIAAVVTKMVGELSGLKSDEERERAFAGARAVLGMTASWTPASDPLQKEPSKTPLEGANFPGVSSAGTAWIKRNGLVSDALEQYFHVEDGKVTLIGEAIGSKKREQSINTYLLTGVAALLEAGKAQFPDEAARAYCIQLGCYDSANHASTLSQFGNRLTGSKKAGWKLTAPGLSAAAALLKPKVQEAK